MKAKKPPGDREDAARLNASRMTRDAWIEAGIEALVDENISLVRIQVIARKLGVSRSSFYWFFADLPEFHRELLQYWLEKNTAPILEHAGRPAPTVTKAVCNVFECWIDPGLFDPRLDAAVRSWAQVDGAIRTIVDQADDQRVEAVTGMFRRYGYAAEEAFVRARVLYFTQVGHFTLGMRDDRETRLSHLRSYLLTFTGRDARDEEVEAFFARMRQVQP